MRRFFGLDIVVEAPPDLASAWGGFRSSPGILLLAGRSLLHRLIRSRALRSGLVAHDAVVVPVGKAARRHVRLACGCEIASYDAFRDLIRILSAAENDQASIFILDSDLERVRSIEGNIRVTFPELRVVGRAAYSHGLAQSVATAIRKADPRLVLVGSTRTPVLKWLNARYAELGNALVLVAGDAADHMIDRGRGRLAREILALPGRLPAVIPLLVHRLAVIRLQRRSKA
jgi:hypothetical protein